MISFYYKKKGRALLLNDIKYIKATSQTLTIDKQLIKTPNAILLCEMLATLSYKNANTLVRYIDGNIDVIKYGNTQDEHSFNIDDVLNDFNPKQAEKQKK